MASRFTASLGLVIVAGGVAAAQELTADTPPPPPDVYTVRLDPAARSEPATGRVILFFALDDERRRPGAAAARRGFEPPQPIASVAVENLAPGASVEIDRTAISFPDSIDTLDGHVRVRAVLDADDTERSPFAGPGNVWSDLVEADVSAARADRVEIALSRPAVPRRLPVRPNLEWVELHSPILSAWYGRDVFHRCGVALPAAYGDPAARRTWPTVYVIPDLGDREEGAEAYARMLETPGVEEIAPIAVYVVLDPESPLGHHGFTDSPNHAPRGTALVDELIPALERRFRLAPRAEARVLTGNGFGGRASLWLLLAWPDTFGAAWISSPAPIDFRSFAGADLYRDGNLYVDGEGRPRTAYRVLASVDGDMTPALTVRDECRRERAIDPSGRSGRRWDTWEAMFSPNDVDWAPGFTPRPRPMFDDETGAIDRGVALGWIPHDPSQLVASSWSRHGPVVMERARIACGALDSYGYDGAVRLFRDRVEALAEADGGWNGDGYIEIIPDETHATLTGAVYQRWNREMRSYLLAHGLHD